MPTDAFPTRDEIEQEQAAKLRTLLTESVPRSPFWSAKFAGVDLDGVRAAADLSRLPLCTKQELVDDQAANAPFGTVLTRPASAYNRIHQTSGTTGEPLRWLDDADSWAWFGRCWDEIYRLAGVTEEDRLFFPFSFGPFIGFWAAFDGAARAGRFTIAGGGMSSEGRLRLISMVAPTVVGCTPTYALRLAEVAEAVGFDLAGSSVRKLFVAGEPGGAIPEVRDRIEKTWGATVFDQWGMTELGSVTAVAEEDRDAIYVLDREFIAEVLDPETHSPVATGEAGELVVTNLGRLASPLIRYRTGDLVRLSAEPSPIGLPYTRLEGGILSRLDDMVTIRGNNVFPSAVDAVLRTIEGVVEYRVTVTTARAMPHLRIQIEPAEGVAPATLLPTVHKAVKERLNFTAEIVPAAPNELPRFEMKGRRWVRA
ncbi:phenylacetate--CoA ligase family protein [Alienimonas chondri]|uniref:Phenylacetate-coenzyme A ligase n=1 Tax=Alienimonas chondri TaxID=2681879 RepID=A0ABX1VFA7_9PLAN|nr:AMP-binding protein [Alienimonas chondri]NNJ25952.1 Phenylacetate-coenzyme A ligase [Alienimonas chondri]